MTTKPIRRAVLICSITLFIAYLILSSVPQLDTQENRVYLRALYIAAFILLIIRALLKHNRE